MIEALKTKLLKSGYTIAVLTAILYVLSSSYGAITTMLQAANSQDGNGGIMFASGIITLMAAILGATLLLYIVSLLQGIYENGLVEPENPIAK